MSQLEYLIALISIIVGLGLTDLAQSLRHLVRPGQTVRWHWLPLTWAAMVFMIVVRLWWNAFEALQRDLFAEAIAFLPYLLAFLVPYLMCSFALPDPAWEPSPSPSTSPGGNESASASDKPLDLEQFYFSETHRRGFFGTLIALLVLSQVISVLYSLLPEAPTPDRSAILRNLGYNVGAALVLASLIVTNRWWVHAVVTVLMFGGIVFTLVVGIPALG